MTLTEDAAAVRTALAAAHDLAVVGELDLTHRGEERRWRFEVADHSEGSRLTTVLVSHRGTRVVEGSELRHATFGVPVRDLASVVRESLAAAEWVAASRRPARNDDYARADALAAEGRVAAVIGGLVHDPAVNRYAAASAVDAFLLVEESADRIAVGLGVLGDLLSGVPAEWALRRAPSARGPV